jgi:uncharacterized protein
LKVVLLALAGSVGAGFLCAVLIAVKSYLGERADYVRTPPADISRHAGRTQITGLREVSFTAHDGSRIGGWYVDSANRAAVVLVHGTGSDRSAVLAETRLLAKAGFGALALDLPGQGVSGGRTYWGVPESQAISAAIDWLSARPEVDRDRIGGFGQSMGAYVMARAAVADKRLSAVVLESCPSDVVEQNWLATARWGLLSQLPMYWALRASGQPLDMKPKDIAWAISPRPLLVIGGELDDLVPAFMSRQIYAAAREPKELWIVKGAHHTDFSQLTPEEYSRRLVEFYSRLLSTRA